MRRNDAVEDRRAVCVHGESVVQTHHVIDLQQYRASLTRWSPEPMESYWALVYACDPLGRIDTAVPLVQRARVFLNSTDTAVWNLCFAMSSVSADLPERFKGRLVLLADPVFAGAGPHLEAILRAPRKEGSFRSWMNRLSREEYLERFWPAMHLQLQAARAQ
jgi:hypothetical protein